MKKALLALLAISPTMLLAQPPHGNQGAAFLKMMDADNNGSVSEEEFLKPQIQRIEEHFSQMDKSGDGQVTAQEADEFIKKMQERFQQMRHGGPAATPPAQSPAPPPPPPPPPPPATK